MGANDHDGVDQVVPKFDTSKKTTSDIPCQIFIEISSILDEIMFQQKPVRSTVDVGQNKSNPSFVLLDTCSPHPKMDKHYIFEGSKMLPNYNTFRHLCAEKQL